MLNSVHRSLKLASFAAIVLGVAGSASAQLVPAGLLWKWSQPWTRPLASHISLVRDCQGSPVTAFPVIAMDDFLCQQTGPIVRAEWWGTSQIPTAPARQFLIRIYGHSGTSCQPTNLLWQLCVNANVKRVGVDCQNRTVWRYSAGLVVAGAPVFTQQAGQRYWIQISEIDGLGGGTGSSPTLGFPDFRWSAHRPIRECPALQRNIVTGVVNQPLLDPCDQQVDDLAFRLYSRTVSGVIRPLPSNKPGTYRICFRDPATLQLLEAIEFSTDDEGNFDVAPEIAEGPVRVYINGMSGVEQDLGVLDLANNEDHDLGTIAQRLGDANGDDAVNFADVTAVLGAFNAVGASTP